MEKRRVTRWGCRLIGGDRNWGFYNKGGGTQLSWPGNEAILFMSIDFVDALCVDALLDYGRSFRSTIFRFVWNDYPYYFYYFHRYWHRRDATYRCTICMLHSQLFVQSRNVRRVTNYWSFNNLLNNWSCTILSINQ